MQIYQIYGKYKIFVVVFNIKVLNDGAVTRVTHVAQDARDDQQNGGKCTRVTITCNNWMFNSFSCTSSYFIALGNIIVFNVYLGLNKNYGSCLDMKQYQNHPNNKNDKYTFSLFIDLLALLPFRFCYLFHFINRIKYSFE